METTKTAPVTGAAVSKPRKSTNTPIEAGVKVGGATSVDALTKLLEQSKAANKALQEQLKEAKKAEKAKGSKVVYLKEGVTGKQVQASAKGLRQYISAETGSLSYCLNWVRKNVNKETFIFDAEQGKRVPQPALSSLYPKAKASDLTPANVLKYRTPSQIAKGQEQLAKYGFERFTFGQVIQWAKMYFRDANGYVPRVPKGSKVVTTK